MTCVFSIAFVPPPAVPFNCEFQPKNVCDELYETLRLMTGKIEVSSFLFSSFSLSSHFPSLPIFFFLCLFFAFPLIWLFSVPFLSLCFVSFSIQLRQKMQFHCSKNRRNNDRSKFRQPTERSAIVIKTGPRRFEEQCARAQYRAPHTRRQIFSQ